MSRFIVSSIARTTKEFILSPIVAACSRTFALSPFGTLIRISSTDSFRYFALALRLASVCPVYVLFFSDMGTPSFFVVMGRRKIKTSFPPCTDIISSGNMCVHIRNGQSIYVYVSIYSVILLTDVCVLIYHASIINKERNSRGSRKLPIPKDSWTQ